jgi:zinc transport system permease protein
MSFLELLLTHEFLRNALFGALLASIACGIVGPFVYVQRMSGIAGGISHGVLGGMGIAYFFHASPLIGAIAAALFIALILGFISLKIKHCEDVMINALWAIGMAVGILFLSKTPGYNSDLMSYLFGSVLVVPMQAVVFMALLCAVIGVLTFLFYKQFVAIAFDTEFAYVRGIPTTFYYLLLLCMVALTVVLLIQVVGLILVIALLTLPAAISRYMAGSIVKMIFASCLLGMTFSSFGLFLSFYANFPSGPTIILVAAVCFILFFPWKREMKVIE